MQVKEKTQIEVSSSNATLIRIPVKSFRRITSPHDENGSRTYFAVVKITDIPINVLDPKWLKRNVRDANPNSKVANKIKETLESKPEYFFHRNRGMTMIVDKVRFDNQTNVLELELVDQRHGLLDGGHTFKVIKDYLEDLLDQANPEEKIADVEAHVKIEILEGISDNVEIVSIVEARNTSTQVKDQSTEDLKGSYDKIKEVLKGKAYAERISYKEYELDDEGNKLNLDVKDILSYLLCFDVKNFSDKHPIKAYSSRASVVDHFKKNKDVLDKLVPRLPVVLELRDVIYEELPRAYISTGGRFASLTGVIDTKKKKRYKSIILPYTGVKSDWRIPSGFIYPILAAFRNLVDKKTYEWKDDPIKLFKETKKLLAQRICEQAKSFNNPNAMGKDNGTWERCYDFLRIEVLERGL